MGGTDMHISYKPLWHTLVDRGWNKTKLMHEAKFTGKVLSNLSKDKPVSFETLIKICGTLNCDITDVIMLERDGDQNDKIDFGRYI